MKGDLYVNRNKGFAIRLIISVVIVLSAIILKHFPNGLSDKIATAVNGKLDYKEAVSAIGDAIGEDEAVEVFEENLPEEDIEALSFQMTKEELHDDTKAEIFRIPAPSNCSYEKVNISFSYTVPLYGTVTSKFGYRDHPIIEDASFHTGIDIAAKSGTEVKCFADGVVLEAKSNKTYGNYLLIEHSGGIRTFYGHNSKLNVKSGQKVKKGQKIALVGTTGMSTGPHLHFEVRNDKKRLDPTHYISVNDI